MADMTVYGEGTEVQAQAVTGSIFDMYIEDRTGKKITLFDAFIDEEESLKDKTGKPITETGRTYRQNLGQFKEYLQDNGIARPARSDIVAYVNSLSLKGLKPNTINCYLSAVKSFFAWTAANEVYPNVAATTKGVKVDRRTHKKDALTAGEVLDIENSIDAHAEARIEEAAEAEKDAAGRVERANIQALRLKAIYTLAVNAGLRTVEISRANVQDLETRGGQTYLWIFGKGHTEADTRKPLAHKVAAVIYEYLDARTDNYTGASPLFVSTGNRSGGKRIAPNTIGQMLKKAMQQAGYDSERITAHSLRHTAGTCVQDLTGDLHQTQDYMRHANPATTEIYLHNDMEKAEAQTAERLYTYYHGQTCCQSSDPNDLAAILQRLNPSQLAQLAGIAAAMV